MQINPHWSYCRRIKNKKVFLFGTAGFGENEAYFQKVLNNVKSSMDESNQVVGEYMCQGKMPQAVRDRYVKMKEQPDHMPNLDLLIANFDRALSHPDKKDLDLINSESWLEGRNSKRKEEGFST